MQESGKGFTRIPQKAFVFSTTNQQNKRRQKLERKTKTRENPRTKTWRRNLDTGLRRNMNNTQKSSFFVVSIFLCFFFNLEKTTEQNRKEKCVPYYRRKSEVMETINIVGKEDIVLSISFCFCFSIGFNKWCIC